MDIIIETKSTNVDITEPVITRVISIPSGKQGEQGIQGIRGEDGVSGTTGVGLDFIWDGTSLGVKREDEVVYSYTNLKGDTGTGLWEADATTNIKPSDGKTVRYSYLSETPDIPINSDFTLSGLGEKSYTNLTNKPSIPENSDFTLAGLSERSYTNLTNTPTIPTNSDFNLASLGDVDDTDKAEGKIISVDSEGNHVYISNAGGTDEKVKFDSEDPTAGYITDKFWGNDGVGTEEGTGDGLNTLRIYNTDKGSTAVSSHLLAFDHNSFITGIDWDGIGGTQTDISLSGFNDDLTYEVPLTFSTGLTRTANTIICNITQYEDSDAVSAIKGDADWNAIDWDTAYSNRIEGASLPLLKSGTNLSIIKASATTNGYLGTDDWNTFNDKLSKVSHDLSPKLGGHLNLDHHGFIIENQIIEGTVVTNNLVLFDESWKKTDADLFRTADRQVGIYIGNNKIMLNGIFETTALSANKVYYISTTPGAMTITAPSGSGDIVRIIGTSLSTTNLLFYPSQAYLELV